MLSLEPSFRQVNHNLDLSPEFWKAEPWKNLPDPFSTRFEFWEADLLNAGWSNYTRDKIFSQILSFSENRVSSVSVEELNIIVELSVHLIGKNMGMEHVSKLLITLGRFLVFNKMLDMSSQNYYSTYPHICHTFDLIANCVGEETVLDWVNLYFIGSVAHCDTVEDLNAMMGGAFWLKLFSPINRGRLNRWEDFSSNSCDAMKSMVFDFAAMYPGSKSIYSILRSNLLFEFVSKFSDSEFELIVSSYVQNAYSLSWLILSFEDILLKVETTSQQKEQVFKAIFDVAKEEVYVNEVVLTTIFDLFIRTFKSVESRKIFLESLRGLLRVNVVRTEEVGWRGEVDPEIVQELIKARISLLKEVSEVGFDQKQLEGAIACFRCYKVSLDENSLDGTFEVLKKLCSLFTRYKSYPVASNFLLGLVMDAIKSICNSGNQTFNKEDAVSELKIIFGLGRSWIKEAACYCLHCFILEKQNFLLFEKRIMLFKSLLIKLPPNSDALLRKKEEKLVAKKLFIYCYVMMDLDVMIAFTCMHNKSFGQKYYESLFTKLKSAFSGESQELNNSKKILALPLLLSEKDLTETNLEVFSKLILSIFKERVFRISKEEVFEVASLMLVLQAISKKKYCFVLDVYRKLFPDYFTEKLEYDPCMKEKVSSLNVLVKTCEFPSKEVVLIEKINTSVLLGIPLKIDRRYQKFFIQQLKHCRWPVGTMNLFYYVAVYSNYFSETVKEDIIFIMISKLSAEDRISSTDIENLIDLIKTLNDPEKFIKGNDVDIMFTLNNRISINFPISKAYAAVTKASQSGRTLLSSLFEKVEWLFEKGTFDEITKCSFYESLEDAIVDYINLLTKSELLPDESVKSIFIVSPSTERRKKSASHNKIISQSLGDVFRRSNRRIPISTIKDYIRNDLKACTKLVGKYSTNNQSPV